MFKKPVRSTLSAEQSFVRECLGAGIERAHPSSVVDRKVSISGSELQIEDTTYNLESYDDVYVVGGGNAAGHIAAELGDILGPKVSDGVIVTDEPQEVEGIDVLEGTHPSPSRNGVKNTQKVIDLVTKAGPDDFILTVVAGGGSALLSAPANDISLDHLQVTTTELLQSGATIDEINTVRKHLSSIKGGQLATQAAPARMVGLVFSDVVGDDLASVASGPIVPDESTFEGALDVVSLYDLSVPDPVSTRLQAGVRGEVPETPTATQSAFENVNTHVLANGFDAVQGAADHAADLDVAVLILSASVRGEARDAALSHVAIAEEILRTHNPTGPPVAVISGGELTVTVRGDGAGGPNQEFALSAALELPEQTVLGSVDTDGLDGTTDAAGALVTASTVGDTRAGRRALERNNAYEFLAAREALLSSGPTGTNVNDLRVMLVGAVD